MTLTTRTSQSRHGVFTCYSSDIVMESTLRIYGEFSEDEVSMYDVLLKPTDVVIEVGANIGALTVPLSRRCKKLFSFEPQPQTYELLLKNLNCNGIKNVDVFPYAVGAKDDIVKISTLEELDAIQIGYVGAEIGFGSCIVEQRALDGMKFEKRNESIPTKINFMKLDCEGSELEVLKGAEELIKHDWPLLYVENEPIRFAAKSDALVGWLLDHGYRCFWHKPRMWRPDNFRNYNNSIFGDTVSTNMICFHDKIIPIDRMGEEVLK